MPDGLSPAELLRYSRHLLIPAVGEAGQLRLKNASVLLVGAGALGSPAALYLAAAGVGRLGLVDADVVDASNLQRQILHGESWIGKPKLESAAARLREVNPHVRVELHPVRFTPENAHGNRRLLRRPGRWLGQFPHPLPHQRHRVLPAGSRWFTARSTASRARPAYSPRTSAGRATGACCPTCRRRAASRPVRKRACSACCRASSARCRRWRRSS